MEEAFQLAQENMNLMQQLNDLKKQCDLTEELDEENRFLKKQISDLKEQRIENEEVNESIWRKYQESETIRNQLQQQLNKKNKIIIDQENKNEKLCDEINLISIENRELKIRLEKSFSLDQMTVVLEDLNKKKTIIKELLAKMK